MDIVTAATIYVAVQLLSVGVALRSAISAYTPSLIMSSFMVLSMMAATVAFAIVSGLWQFYIPAIAIAVAVFVIVVVSMGRASSDAKQTIKEYSK